MCIVYIHYCSRVMAEGTGRGDRGKGSEIQDVNAITDARGSRCAALTHFCLIAKGNLCCDRAGFNVSLCAYIRRHLNCLIVHRAFVKLNAHYTLNILTSVSKIEQYADHRKIKSSLTFDRCKIFDVTCIMCIQHYSNRQIAPFSSILDDAAINRRVSETKI